MPRCMYISGLLDLYMQRVAYIDGTRCIYRSNNKLFQYLLHPCINSWQNLLLTGKLTIFCFSFLFSFFNRSLTEPTLIVRIE